MLKIYKLRADPVLDHAAMELKKYLRMMMPEKGEIPIYFDPEAKEGFRLGLLEDFSLPFEGEDPALDDVIHVETTPEGGVLAGSNPRSVLFSVYRFLRENGCRWLYPGVDGDYVPVKEIQGISYHKMADHRFRGFCNEGSESQTSMLETADFYAKLELNVYMLEWFIPRVYYKRYYNHRHNVENRPPEPVSDSQILQWKVQTETEIAKRGLMFHDIGHGWMTKPFGFPVENGALTEDQLAEVSDEQWSVLAKVGGKRDFYEGRKPSFTNVCLSRKDVREKIVGEIVEYASRNGHVDYLHVWMADGTRNHCECEDCLKKTPSDWYMILMNEIDEALTKKDLATRIVFIVYVDSFWPPVTERIQNPERFSLLYAPIFRSYSSSITENTVTPPIKPFRHNDWETPVSTEENFAYLKAWKEIWKGPCFSYEYHFWRHQYLDVAGLEIARRIYEDVRGLRYMGLDGFVEDGSQRSGFPNGFPLYVYAETLMNRDVSFEEVRDDYFSHIYGEEFKEALAILEEVEKIFPFAYMEGEESTDEARGKYFNLERAKNFARIPEIAARIRAFCKKTGTFPRPEAVSRRLFYLFAEYITLWGEVMTHKARGEHLLGNEAIERFLAEFGKYETEIERYYDHGLLGHVFLHLKKIPKSEIVW